MFWYISDMTIDNKFLEDFDFAKIDPPWDSNRISIHQHILACENEDDELPDEPLWIHEHNRDISANFRNLRRKRGLDFKSLRIEALTNFLRDPDSKSLYQVYMYFSQSSNENDRKELVEDLDKLFLFDSKLLHTLSVWLMKNAPDREIVRTAMVLAAQFQRVEDTTLFLQLGGHSGFLYYAMLGVEQCSMNKDSDLFSLIKSSQSTYLSKFVYRLANSENSDVKRWFIWEAPNHQLFMECSYILATRGELLKQLQTKIPDSVLLNNAFKLLTNMHGDNPGENLRHYIDGPQAMLMLVRHLREQKSTLDNLCKYFVIRRTVEQMDSRSPFFEDWKSVTSEIISSCDSVINQKGWQEKIFEDFSSESKNVSNAAEVAAFYLDVDLWNQIFDRTKSGGGEFSDWDYLVQNQSTDRLEKVLEIAEANFNSNPRLIEPVIKAMRSHPGLGRNLLLKALKCESASIRHIATLTLAKWNSNERGIEIQKYLEQMNSSEKDVFILDQLKKLVLTLCFLILLS